jgi:hypothetical protein
VAADDWLEDRRRLAAWFTPALDLAEREGVMLLVLCVVLLVAWLLGWTAFHVTGGPIHLLLLVAVISLIVHVLRGRGARA